MEIEKISDCGNSPKNQLVEDLTIALITGQLQLHTDLVIKDVQWTMVGEKALFGRAAVMAEMETIQSRSILKVKIDHAITHGKAGAVHGEVWYEGTREGFCFFYEFANIKGTSVRQITSYQLAI